MSFWQSTCKHDALFFVKGVCRYWNKNFKFENFYLGQHGLSHKVALDGCVLLIKDIAIIAWHSVVCLTNARVLLIASVELWICKM